LMQMEMKHELVSALPNVSVGPHSVAQEDGMSQPPEPPESPPSVTSFERRACRELPNLNDRIDAMGLSQEYSDFRERYMGWRTGSAQGARGELTPANLAIQNAGFGYWYPSTDVWTFQRTMSYWIAVTFFEGALFFAISSFLYCYPDILGIYSFAVTTGGYICGKLNFFICTYLMCLEVVNLSSEREHLETSFVETFAFNYSPFAYRKAFGNLQKMGVGPWPYVASLTYFIGVGIFAVGLAAELVPIPEAVAHWVGVISFLLGSLAFFFGGVAECIENGVFTTLKCNTGWWGALLNTLGGLLFLVGSVLGFFESQAYASNFSFGVGSVAFVVGSGAMIVMWKDEQFGLTFIAALNNLGGPNGKPVVLRAQADLETVEEEVTFSLRGATFIMIYCFAATVSAYNFMTSLARGTDPRMSQANAIVRSFNALLPCIFAHVMMGLNSAVVKAPKMAPFRQLYFGCRFLALVMVVSGTTNLVDCLMHNEPPYQPPSDCGQGHSMPQISWIV